MNVFPLLAIAAWINRPLESHDSLIRYYDFHSVYEYYFRPKLVLAEQENDLPGVVAILGELVATEPAYLEGFSREVVPGNRTDFELAGFFSNIHEAYAGALAAAGRGEEAAAQAAAALRLRQSIGREP